MTRGQVAAKVAENKAKHPEKYCPVAKCLMAHQWRNLPETHTASKIDR